MRPVLYDADSSKKKKQKTSNQTLNARMELCDRLQIVISMLRELDVQLNVSHTI